MLAEHLTLNFHRVYHAHFKVTEGKNLLIREVKTSYLFPFQDKKQKKTVHKLGQSPISWQVKKNIKTCSNNNWYEE
jgi:hypothetical protein